MRTHRVWFSTKHRQEALVEAIGAIAKSAILDAANRWDIEIHALEVELDHAHVLLSIDESRTLGWAMQMLKGSSSRAVFLAFPELRLDMGSNAFWQKSYGSRLVHEDEIERVANYIRTQSTRPSRHN